MLIFLTQNAARANAPNPARFEMQNPRIEVGCGVSSERSEFATTDDLTHLAKSNSDRFTRALVWATFAFTLLVILFGAVVRITGSGAGCGSHWPLCDGEVLPQAPSVKKTIEYTHRLTSALDVLLIFATYAWLKRNARKQPNANSRAASVWAGRAAIVIVVESLLGAGIVLLRYVENNASLARAGWTALHLCNTFLLLGVLAMTVATVHGISQRKPSRNEWSHLGLLVLVGALGAVTALGDTLFPPDSLRAGLTQDLTSKEWLVRLRIVHPFFAVFASYAWWQSFSSLASRPMQAVSLTGRALIGAQLLLGVLNIFLLAPMPMQLLHLFCADLLWAAAFVWVHAISTQTHTDP